MGGIINKINEDLNSMKMNLNYQKLRQRGVRRKSRVFSSPLEVAS